jgi:hypothetical protein
MNIDNNEDEEDANTVSFCFYFIWLRLRIRTKIYRKINKFNSIVIVMVDEIDV